MQWACKVQKGTHLQEWASFPPKVCNMLAWFESWASWTAATREMLVSFKFPARAYSRTVADSLNLPSDWEFGKYQESCFMDAVQWNYTRRGSIAPFSSLNTWFFPEAPIIHIRQWKINRRSAILLGFSHLLSHFLLDHRWSVKMRLQSAF